MNPALSHVEKENKLYSFLRASHSFHLVLINKCALLTCCGTAVAACQFMNLGRVRLSFPKLASSPWRCSTASTPLQNYSSCSTDHCCARKPCAWPALCRCSCGPGSRLAAPRNPGAPRPSRDQRPPLARVAVSVSHRNLSPRRGPQTYRVRAQQQDSMRAPNPPDLALLHRQVLL